MVSPWLIHTYCEILPYNKFPHDDPSVIGVILSGSPFSVYDDKAFKTDIAALRGKLPILRKKSSEMA